MTASAAELGPLPKVQGRHRNQVLAKRRKAAAVRMLSQGMTYQQTADELGYASKGTVHRLVKDALAEHTVEAVEDLRRREGDRLDALLHSIWERALAGDLTAAGEARKIIMAGAKLFGLLEPQRQGDREREWPNCQGPETLVIRENDCRHRGCEKHGTIGHEP